MSKPPHPSVTYHDGDRITLTSPTLNGDDVIFAGTSQAARPIVYFADGTANTLNSISVIGSAGHEAYGDATVYMSSLGHSPLKVDDGITLRYGNLSIGTTDGGSVTLAGKSSVSHGSVLSAWAGRYHADPFILAGKVTVTTGSVADFSQVPLQGNGTIDVGDGGTVDVARIVAGLHINVDRGGTLVDTHQNTSWQFLAPIHESAGGTVDIQHAAGANLEVFHRSTGMLDLYHSGGGPSALMASLKFVGDSSLYSTPDGHGGMAITTDHHVGSIPAFFVA